MHSYIRVYLDDEQNKEFFGEGPKQLLFAIETYGSLRKAALSMHMSYSKAFSMIKNAERVLEFSLTEKRIGGKDGGGSQLTREAKEFLLQYDTYQSRCREACESIYQDIFDPSDHAPQIGCIIMASGLSRRFGSNKLLANFREKPLISYILNHTSSNLFTKRIVVTRNADTAKYCEQHGVPVILHQEPYRNDTIRLGLEYLKEFQLDGCLFCPGDQPLLQVETLKKFITYFAKAKEENRHPIFRLSYEGTSASPTLFDSLYFHELMHLPIGKGGSHLLKKYPQQVINIPARDLHELIDIDTKETLEKLENL